MRPVRAAALILMVVMAGLSIPSVEAESDYKGWRFRVWAGVVGRYVESDNVSFNDPTFGMSEVEVDGNGAGFGFDFERRFNKLFGLDLAVGYTELDVKFTQSLSSAISTDTVTVLPIWIAANFHLVNTESLDFWVAPQIAYVSWNDPLVFPVPGQPTYTLNTSNEFPAIGFAFGLDWWLFNNNGLNFAFRFVDADAADNLPIDPTFVTVGYTRRF